MAVGIVRIVASTLVVALVTPRLVADGPVPRRFEFVETHMGSPFRLVLYTPDEAAARRASAAAFGRIAELDRALSDYDVDSELSRLCARAGGPPVPVGADLFEVLGLALDLARRTGGAFDPTIAPVGRLWRRARRDRRMPSPESLARARELVGFENVRLDPEARTVQLLKPGIKLDLGGIAKGYAAGEALGTLEEQGIEAALVAGAGDIALGVPPPGEEGWTIGIAPLEAPDATPTRFLRLRDASVSTSGDAERYVEIDGVRYSHIIDPRTGLGLTDRSSVTVVVPEGALADGLATAVSVLGPERGLELVEATEGAAALIVRGTAGGTRVLASRRWAAIPSAGPPEAGADPAKG